MSFYSKIFSTAERKYSTFDRELVAIKYALKHFRYILQDKSFTVYTDHKPLVGILSSSNPDWSDRVFRTVDYISRFNLEIHHISGKSNSVADGLSRMVGVVIEPPFLGINDLYSEQSKCPDCHLAQTSSSCLKLEYRLVDGFPILGCLLYTSPSPRDKRQSRMPSSA